MKIQWSTNIPISLWEATEEPLKPAVSLIQNLNHRFIYSNI